VFTSVSAIYPEIQNYFYVTFIGYFPMHVYFMHVNNFAETVFQTSQLMLIEARRTLHSLMSTTK
jgi:hypothetical protein